MIHKRFLSIGILAIAALGLGACADQYAYGRAPGYDDGGYYSQYDQYYGDPYGYQYVPAGFIGVGFGWYGDYYYPGTGSYVYDRRGYRQAWNQRQRSYWEPRVVQRQHYQRNNPVIGNRIGRGIANQQQWNRQQVQVDRRGNRIDQQQVQVDRQGNRIERRENQIDRQGNWIERQQLRAQREANEIARQQVGMPPRPARAENPARAERQEMRQDRRQAEQQVQGQARPQRELRQQYQRQQQSYRNGGDRRNQRRE